MKTSETVYFIINEDGELYNMRTGGSGIKVDQLDAIDLIKYGRSDRKDVEKKMKWLNHWAEKDDISERESSVMIPGPTSNKVRNAVEDDWRIVEATVDLNIDFDE